MVDGPDNTNQASNEKPEVAAAPSVRVVARKKAGATGPVVNESLMEKNHIVGHRSNGVGVDACRQLKTKVLKLMETSNLKFLSVTSARPKAGKTTVAVNLGLCIATDAAINQPVLLIDLNLSNPGLHACLGVESRAGITDYLNYDTPLADLIMKTPFERLSLLPVGVPLENVKDMLASPKMGAMIRELKSRFPERMIIVDVPSVLDKDEPVNFLSRSEAVLVVVRDGVTKIEEAKSCLRALKKINVIGTVLNNCW